MNARSCVAMLGCSCALFLAGLPFAASAWAGDPVMKTIHNFTGSYDGGYPNGALAFDSYGNLYGTAGSGGDVIGCDEGGFCGLAFELLRPAQKGGWGERILYLVTSGPGPTGNMIFDKSGNLYSTNHTQLYELSPPLRGGQWTLSDIFGSTSEYGTVAEPIVAANRTLYATSSAGPSLYGSGYVVELTPPAEAGGTWTVTTIYSFTGGTDGGGPFGVVMGKGGNLYGAAGNGGTGTGCLDGANCGVIYELKQGTGGTWDETVVYNFQASDGAGPYAPLAIDRKGNLYGVIGYGGGGANCPFYGGCGEVFEVSPPQAEGGAWTETVIHRFQGGSEDGSNAMAGMVIDAAGNLYGTAEFGGSGFCLYNGTAIGCGTIFELSPPASGGGAWTETILHNFQGGSDGQFPLASLLLDKSGALFGTTNSGGSYGSGSVFELFP